MLPTVGHAQHEGGNDFEIFHHPRTIGHAVVDYEDTMRQIEAELMPRVPKAKQRAAHREPFFQPPVQIVV